MSVENSEELNEEKKAKKKPEKKEENIKQEEESEYSDEENVEDSEEDELDIDELSEESKDKAIEDLSEKPKEIEDVKKDVGFTRKNIDKKDFDECVELGYVSTCELCNSPFAKNIIFIWSENQFDSEVVRKWFKDKESKTYTIDFIKEHFRDHVKPYLNKEKIKKEYQLYSLIKKSNKTSTPDQINTIKQMHWEYIQEEYRKKKDDKKESPRNFIELVKSYKEVVGMEWDLLGQGKSEDEQRDIMKKYIISSLKNSLEDIRDYPEAYNKLAEKLGLKAASIIEYKEEGNE